MSFDPDTNEQALVNSVTGPASHNYARFHRVWVRNNFQSKAEGREIGDYKDFVIIISPGAQKSVIDREVKDQDRREFPQQWAAYSANKDQMDGGTPLERLPGMDKGRADAFKTVYCMSVEQLANMSDSALQSAGMGALEWRANARKYLASGVAQAQELEKLKADNERMQAQIAELMAAKVEPVKRTRRTKAQMLEDAKK